MQPSFVVWIKIDLVLAQELNVPLVGVIEVIGADVFREFKEVLGELLRLWSLVRGFSPGLLLSILFELPGCLPIPSKKGNFLLF